MNDYRIRVEMHPIIPPKPIGFGVFDDAKLVAFLTEEQVRKALAEFDAMKAARECPPKKAPSQ